MQKSLFIALSFLLFFVSCKKADDNNTSIISVAAVNTTVETGTWRVTYYYDKDHDATLAFSGYSFSFAANGTIAAIKTGSTVSGNWSSGNDDSAVKFVLNFISPAAFIEISNDWHVLERTDAKIRLQDISGGGGGESSNNG
ncbi:MAG: hypothetical protein ABJA78_15925 [Ferruginibacter sp.]